MVIGRCHVCAKDSGGQCSSCFQIFYCGPEHQKADWKRHKKQCRQPYEVNETADVGRFMVAARNLSPGDVILKERPAIVGPNVSTASQPLCVECGRPLDEASSSTKCPDCGVPLCSKECGNALTHKSECAIFRRCPEAFYSCIDEEASGVSPTATANYQLVIPVRMVLLRRRDVRRYKSVMALQSHLEERRGTEHERRAENQVVRLMQLYRLHEEADEELLHRICGIFDTNGFDLASDLVGIFPRAAMMMHSCRNNTRATFAPGHHAMTLYAAEKIPRGSPITYSYCSPLMPTSLRRLMLFTGKLFSCECLRCKDKTEMGTMASAWTCQKCEEGHEPVLPDNPLDLCSPWRCHRCQDVLFADGLKVAARERRMHTELENILSQTENLQALEEFVARYSGLLLHPRHSLMIRAKQCLSVGYGSFGGDKLDELPLETLERKAELCSEVLDALEGLEPALSTRIGLCAYELARSKARLLSSKKEKGDKGEWKSDPDQTLVGLLFQRAEDILALEAAGSSYAALGAAAAQERAKLKNLPSHDE